MRFLYKINSFQDFEKAAFCRYLEDMAAKGWMIQYIGTFLLFVKREPIHIQFSIEYKNFETKTLVFHMQDENVQDYLQLCEDCGWHFACLWKNAFVFHSQEHAHPEPLCSDEQLDFHLYVRKTIAGYALSFALLGYLYWNTSMFSQQILFNVVMGMNIYIELFALAFFSIVWCSVSLRYFYHIGKYQYALWKGKKLPQVHTSYHTWYHRLYPVLFSVCAISTILICLFNISTLPTLLYYPYNFLMIYEWFAIIVIVGVYVLDHVVYYLQHKKLTYSLVRTLMLGVILMMVIFLGMKNYRVEQKTVARDQLPPSVLVNDTKNKQLYADQSYYRSFFIKEGIKVTTFQPSTQLEIGLPFQKDITSGIYEGFSEAQARYVLWALMIEQQQLFDTIDTGNPAWPLQYAPERSFKEIKTVFPPVDADVWQVDEGYKIHPNHYIFRKGNIVIDYAIYNPDISEETKLEWMQKGLQEI